MKYTIVKSLLIATVSVLAVYFIWDDPLFSSMLSGSPQSSTFWLMIILVILVSTPELYKKKTQALVSLGKLLGLSLLFTIIIFIGVLFLNLLINGFSLF